MRPIQDTADGAWFFGNAASIASVVMSRPPTEAAPGNATRTSLVRASDEGIRVAVVQSAYSGAIEPLLIDFEIRAEDELTWQLFDDIANSLRGKRKSFIADAFMPG